MKDGFIKVAAATPGIRVADVAYNTAQIKSMMEKAVEEGAKVVVFPELCLTGYTCGDLFTQEILLEQAKQGLKEIGEATRDMDALVFVGLPLEENGELYNVAAALNRGRVLGFTTKSFLPNYGEFYEMRQFRQGLPGRERSYLREDGCPLARAFSTRRRACLLWWSPRRSARMCGLRCRPVSRLPGREPL